MPTTSLPDEDVQLLTRLTDRLTSTPAPTEAGTRITHTIQLVKLLRDAYETAGVPRPTLSELGQVAIVLFDRTSVYRKD